MKQFGNCKKMFAGRRACVHPELLVCSTNRINSKAILTLYLSLLQVATERRGALHCVALHCNFL